MSFTYTVVDKHRRDKNGARVLLRAGLMPDGGIIEYDPMTEMVETFPNTDAGIKADESKNRLDLIPVEALQRVGEVYTYGSKKYADNNWRKGIVYSRLYGATLRHLFAFWCGEDKDKESGLPHLAHATFGLLGLLQYQEEGRSQLDDRFRWPKGATEADYRRRKEVEKSVREVGGEGPSTDLVAKSKEWHPEFGFASVI